MAMYRDRERGPSGNRPEGGRPDGRRPEDRQSGTGRPGEERSAPRSSYGRPQSGRSFEDRRPDDRYASDRRPNDRYAGDRPLSDRRPGDSRGEDSRPGERGRSFGGRRPGGDRGGRSGDSRGGDSRSGGKGKKTKKYNVSPTVQAKAELIVSRNGLPMPIAVKVAQGKVTLASALEKSLRKGKVDRLMKEKGISKALAIDVAKQDLDIERILQRQRAAAHVKQNRGTSILDSTAAAKRPLGFVIDPHTILVGRIENLRPYELDVVPQEGEPVRDLHKTALHLCFPVEMRGTLATLSAHDPDVAAQNLEPSISVKKRRHFKHAILQEWMEEKKVRVIVTRRGWLLKGVLEDYTLHELRLRLESGSIITVFRHAIEKILRPSKAAEITG